MDRKTQSLPHAMIHELRENLCDSFPKFIETKGTVMRLQDLNLNLDNKIYPIFLFHGKGNS